MLTTWVLLVLVQYEYTSQIHRYDECDTSGMTACIRFCFNGFPFFLFRSFWPSSSHSNTSCLFWFSLDRMRNTKLRVRCVKHRGPLLCEFKACSLLSAWRIVCRRVLFCYVNTHYINSHAGVHTATPCAFSSASFVFCGEFSGVLLRELCLSGSKCCL